MSNASGVQVRLDLRIRGKAYLLTIDPEGFRLVLKGQRNGIEMPWSVFVEDDAILYSELQASIRKILRPKS